MIVDNIEETLNGGYAGLIGEVVTEDCYRLKKMTFIPDVIIDLGGNIGVFARHARYIFPETLIVSVEPDPENCAHYRKFTPADPKIILLEKAVGVGDIYHATTAANGTGEVYLSQGLGYTKKGLDEMSEKKLGMEKTLINAILPDQLVHDYVSLGMKTMMKIDCEGGENAIWTHQPSMDALKTIDYIAIELHWYAQHGGKIYEEMRLKTMAALLSLMDTHKIELTNNEFFATKK